MNFANCYKAINKVRNEFPEERWDFSNVWYDNCGCFVGATTQHFKLTKEIDDLHEYFGISPDVALAIFGTYSVILTKFHTLSPSGVHRKIDATKEEVCSLFERYTDFKVRQHHKWQQWEFKHFGEKVTEKRGVCI